MTETRASSAWPTACVVLLFAAGAACLVVPRPAEPDLLPVPSIDRRHQRELARERAARADAARRDGLPYLTRAAGEALRRVGARAAGTTEGDPAELTAELRARVAQARRAHGDEPLLALQAVQTELFVRAVAELRRSGERTADLLELGGDFASLYAADGGRGPPSRLPGPDIDVASAFVVRWALLTGLSAHARFAPTLTDWRAALRLRLETPPAAPTARDQALAQLEAVRVLERKDPDYPAALARGILAYRAGEYAASAAALRVYLETTGSGPWQLRARNYLARATELAPALP